MTFTTLKYNLIKNDTEMTLFLNTIHNWQEVFDIQFVTLKDASQIYIDTLIQEGYTKDYIKQFNYLLIYSIDDSDE